MCGRYVNPYLPDELASLFDAVDHTDGQVAPNYNVAPTAMVPAIVIRHGERAVVALRWGLIPAWARDPRIGARLINARVETLALKPAFREAFERRRCLLPASGYYEWASPAETGAKQPFYLARADGSVLVLAGLYEFWRDAVGAFWRTTTVITTDAADEPGRIHHRTPMTVAPEDWASWLDPDQHDPGALLKAPRYGSLQATAVSTAVNDVRNAGPQLIRPLAS
jgi:putative SOS response-associated peptidase YedK